MIKAIETEYKGYKFRSRLEARWAVFFDSLNIPWIYEPEGLNIDGVKYLPDFYLPDSKQFFEVKGVMDQYDEQKINALISAGYSVVVGYDDGKFQACDSWAEDEFSLCTDESWLCQCYDCQKYWFVGSLGSWRCQCCGHYDGDGGFREIMGCYLDDSNFDDTDLWDVARQARFEFKE